MDSKIFEYILKISGCSFYMDSSTTYLAVLLENLKYNLIIYNDFCMASD